MTRTAILHGLALVTLLLAAPHAANGGLAFTVSIPDQSAAKLHSAFLREESWPKTGDCRTYSATETKKELQEHFHFIIRTLLLNSSNSVDVAARRLVASSNWPDDSLQVRQFLLEQRLLQIRRLADYARNGRFPRNTGYAPVAVPIFVDSYGSDCAVGHLMRMSNWGNAVDAIASQNRLVVVDDVTDGAIREWVLTSGLTIEEAALIQPAYPPEPQITLDELQQGDGIYEREGLRFSNFSVVAADLTGYLGLSFGMLSAVTANTGAEYHAPEDIGIVVDSGNYLPDDVARGGFELNLDQWIFIGHTDFGAGFEIPPLGHVPMGVLITYDVETINPNATIEEFALTSHQHINENFIVGEGPQLSTEIYDETAPFFFHYLELDGSPQTGFPLHESVTVPVDRQSLTVKAFGVANAQSDPFFSSFKSVIHEFRVVPEPSAGWLGMVCLLILAVHGRRR